MGQRLTDKPIVDRSKYPGRMMYIDGEGYVCLTEDIRSPEYKAKRKARAIENKLKRDEIKLKKASIKAELRAKMDAEIKSRLSEV